MKILVVTSVSAEKEAVLRGLGDTDSFDVVIGGVGAAAAAASTAAALSSGEYRLVVCAGIGGGFVDRAEIGSLVIASEIIAADLGAETPGGFLPLEELGFGQSRIQADQAAARAVTEAVQKAGLPVTLSPVLTVSTVTGTEQTTRLLAQRIPGAAAEAMEGYGVAVAASQRGIPVLEIRAVSNRVGPRDRSSWRIDEALKALESASSILREVLQ